MSCLYHRLNMAKYDSLRLIKVPILWSSGEYVGVKITDWVGYRSGIALSMHTNDGQHFGELQVNQVKNLVRKLVVRGVLGHAETKFGLHFVL